MIKARFMRIEGTDNITSVIVAGHADYADYGYDVICASVSSLVITTINALEEYVGIPTNVEISEGVTAFSCVPIDDETEIQAQTLMHALEIGLVGLVEEFDGFVSVETVTI
ncbi:MAG: ribosomal-processing cysteine protease Prp [Eubacteriaceae bacterium]|nr:ribosomal-processing cysteine protease Prp [Eubacteriaceae bacterium]